MTATIEDARIDPEEIRDSAQRLLADMVDRRAGWEARPDGAAALDQAMRELGWYQLIAAEAEGGLGQRFDVLAPIYEELGRSLAPVWLSGTMATIDALYATGSAAAEQLVAAVLENGWRMAVVTLAPGQSLAAASVPMVGGAPDATHFLVIGDGEAPPLLVAADAPGVSVTKVTSWDLGRSYGAVEFSDVRDGLYRLDGDDVLPVVLAHSELALACDSIGGASQCLSETVDYMLGRQQFGRPIASFQALKHRAADHKVAIELARSLVSHASRQFAVRGDGWAVLSAQARILACEAYAAMAEDCVQLFGGVGFTWEYDAHLFLKRALVNQIIGGSPDDLRDRIVGDVCQRAQTARL
jgi:alkylation response protein AidB-like acyl-CoA dehydrogenase